MRLLGLGASVAAALFACALSAAQPADRVRIGFASPLSGAQAHYGRDNLPSQSEPLLCADQNLN